MLSVQNRNGQSSEGAESSRQREGEYLAIGPPPENPPQPLRFAPPPGFTIPLTVPVQYPSPAEGGGEIPSRIPSEPPLFLEGPPPAYYSGSYAETSSDEWSQTVSQEGGGDQEDYPQIMDQNHEFGQGNCPAPFETNEAYDQGEGVPMLTDSPTQLEEPPKKVVVHPGQWEQRLVMMEDGIQQMWSALGELKNEQETAIGRIHQNMGYQRAENERFWEKTVREVENWMGQVQSQLSEIQLTPVQIGEMLQQVQALKAVLQGDQPTLPGEGGAYAQLVELTDGMVQKKLGEMFDPMHARLVEEIQGIREKLALLETSPNIPVQNAENTIQSLQAHVQTLWGKFDAMERNFTLVIGQVKNLEEATKHAQHEKSVLGANVGQNVEKLQIAMENMQIAIEDMKNKVIAAQSGDHVMSRVCPRVEMCEQNLTRLEGGVRSALAAIQREVQVVSNKISGPHVAGPAGPEVKKERRMPNATSISGPRLGTSQMAPVNHGLATHPMPIPLQVPIPSPSPLAPSPLDPKPPELAVSSGRGILQNNTVQSNQGPKETSPNEPKDGVPLGLLTGHIRRVVAEMMPPTTKTQTPSPEQRPPATPQPTHAPPSPPASTMGGSVRFQPPPSQVPPTAGWGGNAASIHLKSRSSWDRNATLFGWVFGEPPCCPTLG